MEKIKFTSNKGNKCPTCDKGHGSSNALRMHISRYHHNMKKEEHVKKEEQMNENTSLEAVSVDLEQDTIEPCFNLEKYWERKKE